MTDHQAKLRTLELFKEWQKKHPEKFAKFVFPIIRHLAETSLVEQLVSVQPMQLPAASMFYLDIVRGPEPWWKRLWRHAKYYAWRLYWRFRPMPSLVSDQEDWASWRE